MQNEKENGKAYFDERTINEKRAALRKLGVKVSILSEDRNCGNFCILGRMKTKDEINPKEFLVI